ncbi:hypothetical protein NE237_031411 [Protea cynaroides]|uniref:Histidine-containing phosphotransfer protein n=1 Tax=Protea cynaroides TaxID=273540 RepID=A0A9Q0L269_9MAGN|nr:hypothetical protein NE237_031411 [Protea cynaroides]
MAEQGRRMLRSFVLSLYDEGILNVHFLELQTLQDENNPSFVIEVIRSFVHDAGIIIVELNRFLSEPVVDFEGMGSFSHQIKGSSSSIGAHLVNTACVEFQQALDANDREGCIRALNRMNDEYQRVRAKFHTFIQMEESLQSYGADGKSAIGREVLN